MPSRKGDLYGAPNFSEHYLKSAVDFKFIFYGENILNFYRTLNRRKNKSGSLLFRLCGIEFVGNFVLFERSEFTKFPLSKFNVTKGIRKSRVPFLLVRFLWASKENELGLSRIERPTHHISV